MVVTCKAAPPVDPPSSTENPNSSTNDPTIESSTAFTGSTNTDEVATGTTEIPTPNPGAGSRRFPRALSNEYFIKPADLLIQNYKLSAGSIRADPIFSCYSTDIPG